VIPTFIDESQIESNTFHILQNFVTLYDFVTFQKLAIALYQQKSET
jgi:hypothetical protein